MKLELNQILCEVEQLHYGSAQSSDGSLHSSLPLGLWGNKTPFYTGPLCTHFHVIEGLDRKP